MKIVIKIILLISVLGYLIFGIARLSGDEDKRICSGVEIIIKDSIKPDFIDKSFVKELVLQTQTQIEGTAIKDINIKFIEEFIQESPYIDSTICYYTPDNLMCIAVFPRQPVLHVMSDAGENYYMDINGNQMPTDRFHLDLSLATGDITREYAHEKLVGIAEYINTHKPWNTEIQQIYVKNPKHIEFIPLTGEHVIVIGEPTDIEEKLDRLRIFYEEGLNKAGWNKYSIIDLNYADQVVCTKKKKI